LINNVNHVSTSNFYHCDDGGLLKLNMSTTNTSQSPSPASSPLDTATNIHEKNNEKNSKIGNISYGNKIETIHTSNVVIENEMFNVNQNGNVNDNMEKDSSFNITKEGLLKEITELEKQLSLKKLQLAIMEKEELSKNIDRMKPIAVIKKLNDFCEKANKQQLEFIQKILQN